MNNEELPTCGAVSPETVLSLGCNSRRRTLIHILADHDRELTVHDLSKEVLAREIEVGLTNVSGDRAMEVTISLYHTHIPKLEEAGIVECDLARKLVRPTEQLKRVDSRLRSLEECGDVA